jgi:DNA-binding FadR family transcriptional regulator
MADRATLIALLAPLRASEGVRSPKTAELVAATLRRMIIDGQLADGDFLPNESQLMAHFRVSRPTLREAVRVLESERLVEVRRGSRTGARVRVPGPEVVARPAALLLELAGATLADVMAARTAIEPVAAKLLAETADEDARTRLARLVAEMPARWEAGEVGAASANLHRTMVELSGNATLGMIAGMLHEISVRHTSAAVRSNVESTLPKAEFDKLMRSYNRLIDLVAARRSAEAKSHWRRHMEKASASLLKGHEKTKVVDLMD